MSNEALRVRYEINHEHNLALIKYTGIVQAKDTERFIGYDYHERSNRECFRIIVDISEAVMDLSEMEIITLLKKISLRRTSKNEQWVLIADYIKTLTLTFLFEGFADDFNINLKICKDLEEAAVLINDCSIDEEVEKIMKSMSYVKV